MVSSTFCGPACAFTGAHHSFFAEWMPLDAPPPLIVIDGMPRLIGKLASVECALSSAGFLPCADDAANATWTMEEVTAILPAGRSPIKAVSTLIALLFQRLLVSS